MDRSATEIGQVVNVPRQPETRLLRSTVQIPPDPTHRDQLNEA